jgi:hypothetical protein
MNKQVSFSILTSVSTINQSKRVLIEPMKVKQQYSEARVKPTAEISADSI